LSSRLFLVAEERVLWLLERNQRVLNLDLRLSREVIEERDIVPSTVHCKAVDIGVVIGEAMRTGNVVHGCTLQSLDGLGKDADFLAKVTGLESMDANHIFFLHLHIFDELLILLFLANPLIESELGFSEVLFKVVNQSSVMLLLILKSFSVLLFALSRIKAKTS
jgi:hypothetical protein